MTSRRRGGGFDIPIHRPAGYLRRWLSALYWQRCGCCWSAWCVSGRWRTRSTVCSSSLYCCRRCPSPGRRTTRSYDMRNPKETWQFAPRRLLPRLRLPVPRPAPRACSLLRVQPLRPPVNNQSDTIGQACHLANSRPHGTIDPRNFSLSILGINKPGIFIRACNAQQMFWKKKKKKKKSDKK